MRTRSVSGLYWGGREVEGKRERPAGPKVTGDSKSLQKEGGSKPKDQGEGRQGTVLSNDNLPRENTGERRERKVRRVDGVGHRNGPEFRISRTIRKTPSIARGEGGGKTKKERKITPAKCKGRLKETNNQ